MKTVDFDRSRYVNLTECVVVAERQHIKFDPSWIQTHFASYDYTSTGWIHEKLFVSLMAELETKSDPMKRWPTTSTPRARKESHRSRREYGGYTMDQWPQTLSENIKSPTFDLKPGTRRIPPIPSSSIESSPRMVGKRFPSNRSDGAASKASLRFDRIKSMLFTPKELELKTQEKLQNLEIQKRDEEIKKLKSELENMQKVKDKQSQLDQERQKL